MSDPAEQESSLRSDAIKDRAADWLWRQQSSDWCLADQAALDEWLAESRYHLVAYWRLKAVWERTERLAALRPLRTRLETSPNRRFPKLQFLAAGCAVAFVAIAATYKWSAHDDRYATAVGQRATVRLADGSQIELNTNSAISVSMGIRSRSVVLSKGEAFFRIHHDAARPFAVLAAGHRIVDLGTEFSVRRTGNQLEVALVEGRARLEAVGSDVQHHATDLTPGEVAVATAESLSVSKVPTRSIRNALAWRIGKLVFNHVTLAEAAAEFNRYNGTKLVVKPNVADLKVSGTFDAGSIGPFANMAKLAFGLRIEQRNHSIVVSRENDRPDESND